jgi:hypothetical protein
MTAIRVKRVIDNPFGGIEFVVVFESQVSKSLSHSLESCGLGLIPQRIVCIRAIHNLSE